MPQGSYFKPQPRRHSKTNTYDGCAGKNVYLLAKTQIQFDSVMLPFFQQQQQDSFVFLTATYELRANMVFKLLIHSEHALLQISTFKTQALWSVTQ